MLEICDKPLLVDADGLNILAMDMDYLLRRKELGYKTILTPHPGEFGRLFKTNRGILTDIAKEYGIILVAKDSKTMITDGETIYMNTYGNSGLGRAGSGDILSGVIGVQNVDSTLKNISDCITDQIEPVASDCIKPGIIMENGKILVSVSVRKGIKPIYCIKKYGFSSPGCPIRIGSTCKEMPLERCFKALDIRSVVLEA